ncbi:MAG: efflux RND transporter periplasmic adaptor subunit [Chromatiales bacterium]|jgi:multidrug efflux system membrane fusion protein|nr:MAG: efflux RND transporter periplasmic adaptor subunit [Chromatiales bacterium]
MTDARIHWRQRLLLPFMALLLAAGCKPGEQAPVRAVTRVGTGVVTSGPAQPPVLTSGVITTREELKLSFKVAGIVRRIGVQEGEVVRAGQQLAALELTEVNAQSEQARQLAEKAERDLVRGEKLRADEVISEEVLESLHTQAAVARAALRAANFNREFSTIDARHEGVVLRKLVEEREFVQPGQAILVLGPSAGGFIVRAGLADLDIVRLRLGDPAIVTVDAFPDQSLQGRITVLPAAADSSSGLFDIEVELAPAPVRLVSGLVARLRIEPALASETTLAYAPIAAVIEADGDQAAVFVAQDGVARRRPVRVAFIAPAAVAIAEGLKAGEVVVTDGALYLEDGESIQVVAPAATAAQ